jgi:hypothetical protein
MIELLPGGSALWKLVSAVRLKSIRMIGMSVPQFSIVSIVRKVHPLQASAFPPRASHNRFSHPRI